MNNNVYVVMSGNIESLEFNRIDSIFSSYEKAASYIVGLWAEKAGEELCDLLAEKDEEITDVWFNSAEIYTIIEREIQ